MIAMTIVLTLPVITTTEAAATIIIS
jgi:hypothetical protein